VGVDSTPHLAWYTEIMDRVSTLSILSILKSDFHAPGRSPLGGVFFVRKGHPHIILENTIMKPQPTLSEVSRITGVKPSRLSRWLDRETIKPNRSDHKTGGTGDYRTFSRATVIHIALVKALMDAGVGGRVANNAALVFTDSGGEVFTHGKTILFYGTTTGAATVKNILFDATFADVTNDSACTITLDINRVVADVDAILKGNTK
jgi:hypothetical protein